MIYETLRRDAKLAALVSVGSAFEATVFACVGEYPWALAMILCCWAFHRDRLNTERRMKALADRGATGPGGPAL